MSPHVIRVWEKRYGAVTPARTDTNRRLYSEEEVERLCLLRQATAGGHKIGTIARLSLEDLRRLLATVGASVPADGGAVSDDPIGRRARRALGIGTEREVSGVGGGGPPDGEDARVPPSSAGQGEADVLVRQGLLATRGFAAERLVEILERGAVRFGACGLLQRVVSPLARELGELWMSGEVTAAHEHFASAIVRDFLMRNCRPFAISDAAPRVIVATPAGQLHELGAVMVVAAAANRGWRAVYLGVGLPAAEIAGAAVQNGALAVLLSVVYPADDPNLSGELQQLRRLLPAAVQVVVGGRSARAYAGTLREIGAHNPEGMEDLLVLLESLRPGGSTAVPFSGARG